MAEGPIVVVAACIVRGDEVLLSQRYQPSLPEAHLKWELPGGKVELGETLEAALAREIQEELGVSIAILRLLPHVQNNVYHRLDGAISQAVVLAFECALATGEPRPRDPTVANVNWISKFGPWELSLLPGTLQFLRCLDGND
jgi:8-oxo-dGTP diphosphatase